MCPFSYRVGNRVNSAPLSSNNIKNLEYAVDTAVRGPFSSLDIPRSVEHLIEFDQDTYSLIPKGLAEIEYFGFRDGVSQPHVVRSPGHEIDAEPATVLIGVPDLLKEPAQCTRQEITNQHLKHGS